MNNTTFEQVAKRIDGFKDEIIDLQKTIIPIKAISPQNEGVGEIKKAKVLEKYLKELFGEVKWINAPHKEAEGGIRPNIYGILPGKDKSKTIWLMAHMDVVPEGERSLWNTDPFTAVVKDGKIYGRGSEDNHQGLTSSYFAIKAIKDEKITPPCNIGLLIVADEENGSDYGIKYILEKHPELFKKDDEFIAPDHGTATGDSIEISEKGIARFKVTVNGKQSHAAYPNNGINANRIVSHLVVKLDQMNREYNKQNPLFDPPFCTMEATKRFANDVSVNTVPGKEVQIFDCRILPDYNFEEFVERFKKLVNDTAKEFGVKIDVETLVCDKPSFTDPEKANIVGLLKTAINKVYNVNVRVEGIGGGTVARFLRYKGLKVVAWAKLELTLHGPNENCKIENLIGDAKVFAHTILSV